MTLPKTRRQLRDAPIFVDYPIEQWIWAKRDRLPHSHPWGVYIGSSMVVRARCKTQAGAEKIVDGMREAFELLIETHDRIVQRRAGEPR